MVGIGVDMAKRFIAMFVAGVVLACLGLLWTLQGAGLVHIRPILCVSDCTPITRFTAAWLVTGLVSVLVGLGLMGWSLRHRHVGPT